MSDGGERDGAGRDAPASPFVSREAGERPPTADAETPRRRRQVHPALFTLLVAVAAFATGLWTFNGIVMPRLVHGPGDVVVPDLVNLTVVQAEAVLRASGLQLSRAGERFDPGVPRGFILSQDPPEGTPVRGQRRVMVVVSLGEENSSVPELAGVSRRTADLALERAGLVVGAVTRSPSEDGAEGMVLGSDPPADAVLPHGASVALLVSTGPGEDAWVMPDLTGRDDAATRRELEALGFTVLAPAGSPAAGRIVAQSPEPGTRVVRGTPITLTAEARRPR